MTEYGLPQFAPPAGAAEAPFWSGVRRGILQLPQCQRCDAMRWYLLPTCAVCDTTDEPQWVELPGTGSLYTATTVGRPFVEASGSFTVGLIDCDGAPEVRLVAPVDRPLPIGARVHMSTVNLGTHVLPVFVPERSPA